MNRKFLALAAIGVIGVGGMALARHDETGGAKVTRLSRRDIIEKLDGKDASATVVEVTFEPGQKDLPHRHAGPAQGVAEEERGGQSRVTRRAAEVAATVDGQRRERGTLVDVEP